MQLRITSYNLWFHKAYREIAKVIKKRPPDVLCLQECYPDDLKRELEGMVLAGTDRYTHRLPIKHRKVAPVFAGTLGGNVGMAIYYNPTKLVLENLETFILPLPWQERRGGRIIQLAKFRDIATKKTLFIANIHLSALLAPNRARRKQLREALDWVAVRSDAQPVVLAGDFNYPLAPGLLRTLMDRQGYAECGTHFSERTHISRLVKGKFDRIFISSKLVEKGYDILPFGLSDHAPVAATVAAKRLV